MAQLRVTKLTLPAAGLGSENPLAMLSPRLSATASSQADESVPAADRRFFGYGVTDGWLPHRGQDDYDRAKRNREFVAIVLENERLRATFLPEVGGRLWSLVHKPTERELLFSNPVFQPGNLAVRGAWVTGGIEWNACVYGHAPHTCSPLFAATLEDPQYGTVLRLYEWDRTRCIPFQLDFLLPDDSSMLFVRVRLTNPHDETIPMYWWSNAAIAAGANVRVISPAHKAYTYDYWGPIRAVDVPCDGELDLTYPASIPSSADYFFRIPDGRQPWITALDNEGRGLIQTSTLRQVGRKLFAWGSHQGGDHWQDFLSTPGQRFFEIQAGLAHTQLECLPMPPRAEWEWIEAYGLMEADPRRTHGDDWSAAIGEVDAHLNKLAALEVLNDLLLETASTANRPPQEILHSGSGWGALERLRREQCNEPKFCSDALVFDEESLTSDQQPWLSLLRDGRFPVGEPDAEPGAWMVQTEWQSLLADSLSDPTGQHWLAYLHLGLMYYAQGNVDAARAAWEASIASRPSGWAYRHLAALSRIDHRHSEAIALYAAATQMLPRLRPLLVEFCDYLLSRGLNVEVLELIDGLPPELRAHSRLQLIEAQAGIALRMPDRWKSLLDPEYELVDIREGESSLTDFWMELTKSGLDHDSPQTDAAAASRNGRAFPYHLDFRVVSEGDSTFSRSKSTTDTDSVLATSVDG